MERPDIDLVYFDGCPHADRVRETLRLALDRTGQRLAWREWNLSAAETPERFRRFGSPTVLVNGRDVTGGAEDTQAMACRTDGVPTVDRIREVVEELIGPGDG